MDSERLTMTVEEAAKALGIGRNLAYQQAADGVLPTVRIGRRLLVPREALKELLRPPFHHRPSAGLISGDVKERVGPASSRALPHSSVRDRRHGD